ncbi:MAG: LD-carboxypeptidase [Flavobacteriales bacterium]|nr:LD-carboxypeptidase [Flavobacteriales bacterium]
MRSPAPLKPGETIAIIPTARAIMGEELAAGIALAESWGLRVRPGAGVGRKHFQQAGTAAERQADLQSAIDDPSVRAIWCARGGYGTVHLMDGLDLTSLKRDPKWVIGFSDITVLHNALHRIGIASLHGQMPFNIASKSALSKDTLKAALFGEAYAVVSDQQRMDPVAGIATHRSRPAANRMGHCEAELIGGNLSLLYALRGTPYDIDPRGKILFLEDLDELLYHVDRMVMNLRLAGWFQDLAGLIIGGMTDMHDKNPDDPFGLSGEEIILQAATGTAYPVCLGFPAGHIDDNRALIMGQTAKLSVTSNGATLSF